MRAFLTGGTGFIGCALSRQLRSRGHDVIAPSHDVLDVTVAESVRSQLHQAQPDWVFHLAAKTKGTTEELERTNVAGTRNMLEAAKNSQVKAVVIAGSNAEYGDIQAPFVESMTPRPVSAYGKSKYDATMLALRYSGAPVTVLRFSNVYGPGGHSFIELLYSASRSGERVHTSTVIERDFVHVDDIARACIAAAEHIEACTGLVLNIASGEVFTTHALAQLYAHKNSIELPLLESEIGYEPTAEEQRSNAADTTLAQALISWSPQESVVRSLDSMA